MNLFKEEFMNKYHIREEDLLSSQISWKELENIYYDYVKYRNSYKSQSDFIADTLRSHDKVHSVKSRVKEPEHLIEKIIRKTPERRERYGSDFHFTIDNYKEEITDLIGVRAIHIFKEDWESIHKFLTHTWKVIEITANIREGDDTHRFEELDIDIVSRKSGYRSVHYLIEFFPTSQKVIAEIQVRTIFEEGYGEIDHQLRYLHKEIPEILGLNLLLLNRIVGSSDEMASFINLLQRSWSDMESQYESIIEDKNHEIETLKKKIMESSIDKNQKEAILSSLDSIVLREKLPFLTDKLIGTME